jgi:hypothetical protein
MGDVELAAFLRDLRSALRCEPSRRDRIVDEARAHIEDAQASGIARGLSAHEAMRDSLAAFGSATQVARRFDEELRGRLFSRVRFRFLCFALIAEAFALGAVPLFLRFAPPWAAKCLISGMFVCLGALLLADVVRLGPLSARSPLSWVLVPYLGVAIPFAAANFVHRHAEKMQFCVLGIPATVIHGLMVTLFVCLTAGTVVEILQARRLSRA